MTADLVDDRLRVVAARACLRASELHAEDLPAVVRLREALEDYLVAVRETEARLGGNRGEVA